jgi:hypothetical protein
MPSCQPATMPPCISPIAPSTVLSVVMMSSPTPSHGNGNIRAYVSTIRRIRIGRDITPTHHAQDSREEYHQQHALHDVPHACVSWIPTFSLSHNVIVNFLSIMARRRDWHACHRERGEQPQRLDEGHPSPYVVEDQRTCCCGPWGTEVHQGCSSQASTGLRWHGRGMDAIPRPGIPSYTGFVRKPCSPGRCRPSPLREALSVSGRTCNTTTRRLASTRSLAPLSSWKRSPPLTEALSMERVE